MVHIDPENPKVACFTVNKAAGGMARKLVIALKGTGCPKVQIILDDGTPLEAAEGEPEEDQEDGQQLDDDDDDEDSADAPDDADQDHADAHAQDPGSDATDAAPTDPAASASGQPDAAALSQTLTGLVRQMMAVIAQDPSQKAGLAELATDVQACLKRGDLAQAAAGLESTASGNRVSGRRPCQQRACACRKFGRLPRSGSRGHPDHCQPRCGEFCPDKRCIGDEKWGTRVRPGCRRSDGGADLGRQAVDADCLG